MTTIYLITGANRGLGRGLAELYLARPNNIVVAAVRDPASESSRSLLKVRTGAGSKVILVKIDSTSETDPKNAVRELQDRHGISHLDVVIANAGVENNVAPVKDVSVDELYKVIAVNGIGPILLFQAALPLLERSPKTPIFAPMGSMMGSIGGMESVPFRGAAYGPSKAMLNWITRKIHFEHENLIAVVMDPGFVQTDLGNAGARAIGLEKASITVEESIQGLVKFIDGATREETSGRLGRWDGSELPW